MKPLFLCGDVMTGRGIDQVLPHSVEPTLHEPYMLDARGYVQLAEEAHGAIRRPIDFGYIWGDAIKELTRVKPAVRIINLETSVTTSEAYWQEKSIHYRMHPANIPCLLAAGIDCCVLSNNHTLDWGYDGLLETLGTIENAGILFCGAGRNAAEAARPATFVIADDNRVLIYGYGGRSSGVPPSWKARADRPGVNYLARMNASAIDRMVAEIRTTSRPDDIVVCSIHWGGNWGYDVPGEQIELAHRLIDEAGVDIVHGHSSHHVKGIEVYNDKLILYGCGDFLTDYEGISGYESYRGNLTGMYFPTLDRTSHRLVGLEIVPMTVERFQLRYASDDELSWLEAILSRESRRFGSQLIRSGRSLLLHWQAYWSVLRRS